MTYKDRRRQEGFTIIELMIATTVLSTMLLLVTAVMISIGNLYSKGVHQSQVQGSVRNIANDLSQHLQLTDQSPTASSASLGGGITAKSLCLGSVRYTYVVGVKPGEAGNGIKHVMWRNDTSTGDCTPADLKLDRPSADGVELVPGNSRLTYLCVTGAADPPCVSTESPYRIEVGVAYGDLDLLKLNTTGPLATTCRGAAGGQFCATAGLTTTAVKRIKGQGAQ